MFGTGVLDMKGGIIIALYAIRDAVNAGLKRPVRLILAGDEEINHLGSRAADVMTEEAYRYFAGDITAKQAAEYAQNRISLYLAEQS